MPLALRATDDDLVDLRPRELLVSHLVALAVCLAAAAARLVEL